MGYREDGVSMGPHISWGHPTPVKEGVGEGGAVRGKWNSPYLQALNPPKG